MNEQTTVGPSRLSRSDFLKIGGQGLLGLALIAACQSAAAPTPTTAPTPEPSATPTPAATLSPTAAATSTASPVSVGTVTVSTDLAFKIAQMVMVGFRGTDLSGDNPIVADIRDRQIGGVFLFDYDIALDSPVRNIRSPQQVQALTSALHKLARVPLLIGTDEEGGAVARLDERHGFPPTIAPQTLGTANNLQATHAAAGRIARTLADNGVNLT